MGLVKGLLTLPLAPVRGAIWLAERVAEQAEREWYDEDAIRRDLLELQMARDLGEVTDLEYQEAETDLVARLMEGGRRRGP